jgi:hypothetical protein
LGGTDPLPSLNQFKFNFIQFCICRSRARRETGWNRILPRSPNDGDGVFSAAPAAKKRDFFQKIVFNEDIIPASQPVYSDSLRATVLTS